MRRALASLLLLLAACDGAFETRDGDFAIPTDSPSPGASSAPARRPTAPTYSPSPAPPSVADQRTSSRPFAAVRAGDGYTCALESDGSVTCWGQTALRPQWALEELAVRDATVCGLTSTGALRCWGDTEGWVLPASPSLRSIGLGYRFACALEGRGGQAGRAHCWGPGAPAPPAGEAFASLAVGWSHACGLEADGTLACWGDPNARAGMPEPSARFASLALGGLTSCALDAEGEATCWGDFANRPPARRFVQLAAGNGVACGVRKDGGGVVCWGNDVGRIVSDVPFGRYAEVSVGTDHACAVRADDGFVRCWGNDDVGQATPP